jgi:chromate transporter
MTAADRAKPTAGQAPNGSAGEVFAAFLPLGFTSFGGPVAHLGFFRTAFVERRGWLTDEAYADLVALCQFMPGPASSQVGMAIGLRRAGILGLFAAWTAFTLPSAIALAAFGLLLGAVGVVEGAGWLLGLKAAAVAVVAHALLGMAGTLAGTRERATIAAAAAVAVLLAPDRGIAQLAVIAAGALAGLLLRDVTPPTSETHEPAPISRRTGIAALVAFFALLAGLPLLASLAAPLDLLDRTYRAGALVFGGGHVVLPLLEGEMAGMVDESTFLAGYGAAQAVPGPLFTFAAFLGAVAEPFGGPLGAAVALVGIFLPSVFLVLGIMPFWEELRRAALARRMLAGVNAAVVGLLAAAFYDPVFTRGVGSTEALALAVVAFVALRHWAVSPWIVVIAAGGIGWVVL